MSGANDLISREAAIEVLNKLARDNFTFREYFSYYLGALHDASDGIKALPSAQPERKNGKWIHDGYDFTHGTDWIHCSICGKRGINVPADKTNFCPNCGSWMVEGGQDG